MVCGLGSLGTRGATEGIRGKLSLADLAAHSGLAGGIRDSPGVSLGTRDGSEGSRRGGFTLRHSGQVSLSEGLSGRGFGGSFKRRHSAGLREGFERLRKGRGLSGTRVTFRKGLRKVF